MGGILRAVHFVVYILLSDKHRIRFRDKFRWDLSSSCGVLWRQNSLRCDWLNGVERHGSCRYTRRIPGVEPHIQLFVVEIF